MDEKELLELIKALEPEVVKSIRGVAPHFRGYRLPYYGKKKAEKDYQSLLDALEESRINITDVVPEDKWYHPLILGSYAPREWYKGIKYDDVIGNIKEAWTGTTDIYINPKGPKYGFPTEDVLFHELLHGITGHAPTSGGRLIKEEDFLSRLLHPTSTGSFNYQAKSLYDAYLE